MRGNPGEYAEHGFGVALLNCDFKGKQIGSDRAACYSGEYESTCGVLSCERQMKRSGTAE